MKETVIDRNGTCAGDYALAVETLHTEVSEDYPDDPGAAAPLPERRPSRLPETPAAGREELRSETRPTVAIFCYEPPDGTISRWVAGVTGALARRQTVVHLFSRQPFALEAPGVTCHALGGADDGDLFAQVQDFTSRAAKAFVRECHGASGKVSVIGCEWSSVPVLSLVHGTQNADILLALHSLERQRSDMTSDISREIEGLEQSGLREARAVLFQEEATAAAAKALVPECAAKLVSGLPEFPVHRFTRQLDPGHVKARYQVGPIDPTILYIGDLDERHGPDVLVKSLPAVLKNNKQARLIVVGDGSLQWPLRVYARYLLLEHAVRFAGSVEGQPLFELIQAADLIVVPSRLQTEWWPIQAAWAGQKPVVASRELAAGLDLVNEENCVLIYPHESSCVWGIERVLFDPALGHAVARRGQEQLEERFGWTTVAARVEELMGVATSR
jgi:glycosyltransferase involved in cell wall biosynthesis